MRRLYAGIAGGVIMAVLAGWISVGLLLPQLSSLFEQGIGENVFGGGLPAIAARLDGMPRTQWPEGLDEARREITIPIQIVATDMLPANVASRVSRGRPALVSAGRSAPSIYIPLQAGSYFLVAGPLPRPPIGPLITPALIFVLVMTATASAVVGIPLVRKLRRLRHAIAELGGGNWAMRLDANAEGALSELAESINRMAIQLQGQFQEREALLQAVSHEIGTPLSRMRFQVELLDGEIENPALRSRLAALSSDLDELDRLSTELVVWMETDATGSSRQTFEVASVLRSLVELECYGTTGVLSVELTAPADLMLIADQRRFQRAVENLLRNALRYAQQRIVVEAKADSSAVFVEVRDDGPGIARDQWTRVLDPFVRIEGPGSLAHRGLGLGLAIVRRIVEAHGGTIVVTDAPEGGTRVLTSWPCSQTAAGPANVSTFPMDK